MEGSFPLRHVWAISLFGFVAVVAGCGGSGSSSVTDELGGTTTSRVDIVVVNYPLQFFAERIGGDLVRVTFPVPESQDPAYWEPTGEEIAGMQTADFVILNGADYAKWTLRATLPWSRTIVTCENLESELIEIPDAVVHNHGPEGEHSHAGLVSETWWNPELAIKQARAICDALCERFPERETDLEERFSALQKDLQTLAGEFDAALTDSGVHWLSAKPRFNYLFARYGNNVELLHWEATETIEAEEWEALTNRLNGDATVALWAETPLAATHERLEELGVACVVLDTVATAPTEGDYLSAMRSNLDLLRASMLSAQPTAE